MGNHKEVQPSSRSTSINLVGVIKSLYGKATSAVLFNSSIGDCSKQQLESEKDATRGTVSTGGKTIINLRFADDINGLAGEEEELAKLVEHINKASTAYGMEISAEKTKQHQWHQHRDYSKWTEV